MNKLSCLILLFLLSLSMPAPAETKNSNKITKVNLIQDEKSSRVVIELTDSLDNLPIVMATLETVSFDLDALCEKKQEARSRKQEEAQDKFEITADNFIKKVQWFPGSPGKTSFEIKRGYYTPVNLIKQEKPLALVIEFPRNYFNKESRELKPGITHHLIRTINERGPITANALEIDLSNEKITVKVGLPDKKKIKAKDFLTNIVKNEMAFAGINANYFDVKVGNPLGTLITEGTWLIGPVYDRVAIGFSEDKQNLINQVMLIGNATVYRGFRKKPLSMFEVDGLNIPPHLYKKIGLFTSNWDEELDLGEDKTVIVIRNGCVKKRDEGPVKIPSDGYALVSNKDYSLDFLKKRDRIKIEWQSNPDWSNVAEAVSGGPYLIKDGEIYVDELNQHFKFSKKETYAPRSAVGIGKNGKLYMVAVDGRRNGYSVGLTLKELADFLKKLDLQDAINLDGGGSTELVADGKIINKLSEHHERKISNALLIFYKE